jgi:hypothetical protein
MLYNDDLNHRLSPMVSYVRYRLCTPHFTPITPPVSDESRTSDQLSIYYVRFHTGDPQ